MARDLSAASRRWYEGLPAVTRQIECGGERHRITWRRGKLVVEDHDVLAERSLTAFGAKLPMCVEVLDAWRRVRGPELLQEILLGQATLPPGELARRKASHEAEMETALGMSRHLRARLGSNPRGVEMVRRAEQQAAERLDLEERMWAITVIQGLPVALRNALALSVIVKIERHWHDEGYRQRHAKQIESALTAIATPHFEHSTRQWRPSLRPHAGLVTELRLLAPNEEPTCAAWADGRGASAVLSLPLSWFTDVWARGIALVDGSLVLGLAGSSGDDEALHVVALRWERGRRESTKSVEAPALLSRGGDGGWVLHWV